MQFVVTVIYRCCAPLSTIVLFSCRVPFSTVVHLLFCLRYDGMALAVTVNGGRVAEAMVGEKLVMGSDDENSPLVIGALYHGDYTTEATSAEAAATATHKLRGSIDDVAVWAEGRTMQQIQADMVRSQMEDEVQAGQQASTYGAEPSATGEPLPIKGGLLLEYVVLQARWNRCDV